MQKSIHLASEVEQMFGEQWRNAALFVQKFFRQASLPE